MGQKADFVLLGPPCGVGIVPSQKYLWLELIFSNKFWNFFKNFNKFSVDELRWNKNFNAEAYITNDQIFGAKLMKIAHLNLICGWDKQYSFTAMNLFSEWITNAFVLYIVTVQASPRTPFVRAGCMASLRKSTSILESSCTPPPLVTIFSLRKKFAPRGADLRQIC